MTCAIIIQSPNNTNWYEYKLKTDGINVMGILKMVTIFSDLKFKIFFGLII